MSTYEGSTAREGVRGRVGRWFATVLEALGIATRQQLGIELLIFFGVCAVAASWGLYLFSQFDFLRMCRGFDLWFDSDPARTIANITSRWVIFHERSVMHPLYSLFVAAPFGAIGQIFALRTSTVTTIYVATQSALYAGAAYIALRAFGLAYLDAILGVVLLFSTSAAFYWIGFPEWIALGATSVLVSVIWIAAPARLRNDVTGAMQNLISGAIATTSWVVGAAASLLSDWPKLNWGQAYRHTRDAVAFMAAFTFVQYYLFPATGGFLNIWREAGVFLKADLGGRSAFAYAMDFFGQTLIAPDAGVLEGPRNVPGWGILIMTSYGRGISFTPLTSLIFVLWITLLVMGLLAAARGAVRRPIVVLVIGALLFFYVLHAVLGGETFLFTLHFAPLLTFIALWGVNSPHRWIVRGVCMILIVASVAYNYPAFRVAVRTHNAIDASWLDRPDHPAPAIVAQTDCR